VPAPGTCAEDDSGAADVVEAMCPDAKTKEGTAAGDGAGAVWPGAKSGTRADEESHGAVRVGDSAGASRVTLVPVVGAEVEAGACSGS
jgi:hypothetical protein